MVKNTKPKKKDNLENALQLNDPPRELVGSDDVSFMTVLISDLVDNMWLPEGMSDERILLKVEAAKETLRQIAPQDGIEGMLAVQMASTHQAAMECLRRASIEAQTNQGRDRALKQSEKLLRLYMDQVKALGKHRGAGDQKMTVEHVNIEPGGQAFVGQVKNNPQHKK